MWSDNESFGDWFVVENAVESQSRQVDRHEITVDDELIETAANGGGEVRSVTGAARCQHHVAVVRVIADDRAAVEVVVVHLACPAANQLHTVQRRTPYLSLLNCVF